MNINLEIISCFILFLLYCIYLYTFSREQNANWLRALILAVAMQALWLLPTNFGTAGWIFGIIFAYLIILRLVGKGFSSAILFLLVTGAFIQLIAVSLPQFLY